MQCEYTAGFDTAEGTTILLVSYLLLGVLLGSNIFRTVPQAGRLRLHSCILNAILPCMLLVVLAEACCLLRLRYLQLQAKLVGIRH